MALLEVLNSSAVLLLTLAAIGLYINQRKLLAALRKAHPNGDPCASGAAVAQGSPAASSGEREAPPAEVPVLARFDAPFQPTPGQIEAAREAHEKNVLRAQWEAEEDARDREAARKAVLNAAALRAAEAGAPDSQRRTAQLPLPVAVPNDRPTVIGGVAPEQRDSDGETRLMELPVGWNKGPIASKDAANVGRSFRGPWVEETQLSAGTLAKLDRLAAERGTTREAMAADLARTGIEAEEERRAAGPTTPPSGPANDAPPPSGRRRM